MAHPRSPVRVPSQNFLTSFNSTTPEMHFRPLPISRSTSSLCLSASSSRNTSPNLSPLLPSTAMFAGSESALPGDGNGMPQYLIDSPSPPTICGMPLKYVSLVTLAVQNAALSIVMHYSRVSTSPALSYSPSSAVLLNEILKGSISFVIALSRTAPTIECSKTRKSLTSTVSSLPCLWISRFWSVSKEVFSPDCWKLSIPALLYVIQNSLQFVAVGNLPVASFQVTYQMKILTTAAFSVMLLRKRLSSTKWLSLFFLAIGVGIVQIQATSNGHSGRKSVVEVGSAHDFQVHVMSPLKGFGAVIAACFTSGLAGVYFEMVLKGSKADLWVRNVQLSLWSLLPALLPVLFTPSPINSLGFVHDFFRNFGGWAWATVLIQVIGGLVTAVVIKHSDNILKGFATSLSIVLSSLASVILFNFQVTPSFAIGSATVLAATWMYNQPPGAEFSIRVNSSHIVQTPISGGPILGDFERKRPVSEATRAVASALGLKTMDYKGDFPDMLHTGRYLASPYGSPFGSRSPSRAPTPSPCLSPTEVSGHGQP